MRQRADLPLLWKFWVISEYEFRLRAFPDEVGRSSVEDKERVGPHTLPQKLDIGLGHADGVLREGGQRGRQELSRIHSVQRTTRTQVGRPATVIGLTRQAAQTSELQQTLNVIGTEVPASGTEIVATE